MHSITLLPLLLATTALAIPISIADETFPRPCAPLHIIVARGTCDSGEILDNYGEGGFHVIADMVTSQVSGANSFGVVYPATGLSSCPSPAYAVSESTGVTSLTEDIVNYATRCPSSKIALIGYSQGAHVVGDVMCGASEGGSFPDTEPLADEWADHVVAAVLFGDPGFVAGESYNRGTNSNADGIATRKSTASCKNFASKMESYCNSGDPICSSGHVSAVHSEYITRDGDAAAAFLLAQYKASIE